MLPFLKNKKDAGIATGIIIKHRQPDNDPSKESDDPKAAIKACASDLIEAIHARDIDKVAEALYAAFEIAESQPHQEGEHIDEIE